MCETSKYNANYKINNEDIVYIYYFNMTTPTFGDIATLVNIQSTYLKSLIAQDTTNSNAIRDLNTSLNNTNTKLAHGEGTAILTKYNTINKIIDDEKTRLDTKQTSIEDAANSKKRVIALNTNYMERTQIYTNMIIAWVIGIVTYFILTFIQNFLPIPDVIISTILIIVFSIIIIFCLNQYLLLTSRNKMDFNNIEVQPPKIYSTDEKTQKSKDANMSGNLFDSLNLGICNGPTCCGSDTTWDINSQSCVPTPHTTQPFTTFFDASKKEKEQFSLFSTNMDEKKDSSASSSSTVQKYSPNEFEKYNLYM
jgi:uncharacterized protein YaaQ